MKKKIIVIVLIIAAAVGVWFYLSKGTSVYKNEELGFQFKYPSELTVQFERFNSDRCGQMNMVNIHDFRGPIEVGWIHDKASCTDSLNPLIKQFEIDGVTWNAYSYSSNSYSTEIMNKILGTLKVID